MSNPTFSIITATYNRAELLKRAANSVFRQTFKDFEWIIIDDGSTDNTKEVIASFDDPRIVFGVLPENRGVNVALNKALDLAKGEYLVSLDSDDELLPNTLETFFNLWQKVRDKKIVSIKTRAIDGNTREKIGWWREKSMVLGYKEIFCGRNKRGESHGSSKRNITEKVRLEEDVAGFGIITAGRIRRKGWKVWYVDVPTRIYHRNRNGNSLSSSHIRDACKMVKGYEILLKENKELWLNHCPDRYVHYLCAGALRYILCGKNKKRAREMIKRVFQHSFFSFTALALYLLSFFPKGVAIVIFKLQRKITST